MTGPAFELNLVQVVLGGKAILHDIRLNIPAGRFISILGRNGSGKTTLMKTLAALIQPQSGTIRYKEKILNHYSPRAYAREVSYVPQFLHIEFDYSVEEFVLLGRLPHTKLFNSYSHPDHGIVHSALQQVDSLSLAERSMRTLSGGERQKVMIARSIAQECSTILLDEPTSHLDLANQIEILDILKKLTDEGKTVISILHDPAQIRTFSDRVIMMRKGEILTEGETDKVLNPETVYQCLDVRIQI